MESLSEATQEYLESIYWLYESGIERTQANLARALQVSQPSVSEMLRRMVDDDLVSRDEAKLINFTDRGREVAERIVARHRLVEAYLVKVMGIPWDDVHEEAHAMEHSISPRLEAKMLEMIGDVHTCPHGHRSATTRASRGSRCRRCPSAARSSSFGSRTRPRRCSTT
jgi:DtxR family Mn-dependent transcriptional regulator